MNLELTPEQRVADRYLRSFVLTHDRLESSVRALTMAESALGGVSALHSAFGGSSGEGDRMLRALVSIQGACDDLCDLSARYSSEYAKVEEMVSEVQRADQDAGRVLRLTYIDQGSTAQICEATGLTRKRVYECLRRGLDEAFEEIGGGDAGGGEDR